MPIYEYQCRSCDKPFEELVRSAKEEVVKCPACGSGKLDRRLSVFAARQAEGASPAAVSPGGCGRCGDPRGPGSCQR
jgi:putative FmdB family regulatory protein